MKPHTRCKVWKYGITLWNGAINLYQNVTLTYNSRAVQFDNENKLNEEYYNRGNLLGNNEKYDEAINDVSMAIKLKNDYALVYFGRGI